MLLIWRVPLESSSKVSLVSLSGIALHLHIHLELDLELDALLFLIRDSAVVVVDFLVPGLDLELELGCGGEMLGDCT